MPMNREQEMWAIRGKIVSHSVEGRSPFGVSDNADGPGWKGRVGPSSTLERGPGVAVV
jgi:hypothetical protein